MSALKFKNKPTEVDGIAFASRKEAKRYGELKLLQRAGEIEGLKVHPSFPLDVNGKPICRYVGDFEYRQGGVRVVEDVKSEITRKHPVYRLKNKLFEAVLGFQITEV
jgi:hypothetical protein